MPRRPSASVVPTANTPNASAILVHRTIESQHVFPQVPPSTHHHHHHHHALQTLGASATPQQKIVQVLVNRLKHKLPCNSGLSLDRVESDQPTQQAIETLVELSKDSLDMIAWALSELLDRLAKQTDSHTGHLTIEVLQSQLFILKVLSMTMASRWSQNMGPASRQADDQPLSSPDSPLPPGSAGNGRRQAPSEYSSNSSWQEPPPLDDSCVKYILSVMVLFMRQTSSADVPLMLQTRSTDISFRDFEDNISMASAEPSQQTPPQDPPLRTQPSSNSVKSAKVSIKSTMHISATNTAYEKTHMSLVKSSLSVNNLIAKYVGRIIFHISASNWNVVFDRLSTKISFLATHPEANPDIVDLQLMSHSLLDRHRLVLLLNQLSSLLVNMRKEAQLAIAVHLRSAVWNWIDIFPSEFNEAIRTRGKTEGAPERVFDLLYSLVPPGSEKIFWPTLTILNCITSDRISADFQYGGTNMHKSRRQEGKIRRNGLDMCRAAAYIDTTSEVPLRLIAADIAHEIKGVLYSSGINRKAFWESYDDIDVALYSDALVAVFRFLPIEDSGPLFEACVEPERSEPVKTCVIRACLTIVQDKPRFLWQKTLDDLPASVAARCRDILKSAGVRRVDVDQHNNTKRVATRPKAKRIYPEPLSDREVLILGILSLWRAIPVFFMRGIVSVEDVDNWNTVAVRLWEAPIDISVKISTASCMRRVSEQTFLTPATDPNYSLLIGIVKSSLPLTLLSVVGNLLTTRTDLEAQRLWISIAHQVIEVYVTKSDMQHVKEVQVDPRRIPAFALAEIAFLVALTSADNGISQLAAKGLRLLAYAERQQSAPVNVTITDEERSKRNPVYEQLGDPRITVVGRLGHQKRIRKLVRMLSFSMGMHIVVWEECYWRWRALNESVITALSELGMPEGQESVRMTPAQQEIRFQWQNLTLYLAALGGSCLREDQDLNALVKVIPSKFLPDKIRVVQNPIPLVEDFIADLISLLVKGDMQIRDIVRDALGTELSPRLYGKVIRNLEDTLHHLTASEETAGDVETYLVVVEQMVAILKLIADNTQVALEDVMAVDMSPIMLSLGRITHRCAASPSILRIKIKYCSLDTSVRHELLDVVLQWMQPVKSATDHYNPTHNDLNMACLRAAVKLLDRLDLKAVDATASADDGAHAVFRHFNKYSTALLASIETCQPDVVASDSISDLGSIHQRMRASQKEAELRELVITGLTHLVSASSESGFKQCLPLAYDQDNRKRTIFAHVFARVIGQGTVFDPEDRSLTKTRHTALCDLVRGSDMVLAMTICEICPPGEVEMMISVLLNIFDSRASLMGLIKLIIEREVNQTDNEASLFRSNSTCSRFLSAFARLHGYNYLRSLVQPLLDTMLAMPPGSGYEIDPTKAAGQDIVQNQENVEYVASTFLTLMSSSLPTLPSMFREICAHIAKVVAEVWPEAKFAAMGAFIFLRFISPAVVTPETIDIEVPKDENSYVLRRGLMVIAKIIQNLANNIFFGKEAHMTILNKFLESNITNVTRFLSELHKYSGVSDETDNWSGTTTDESDVIVLHRFFHKHADKIGKELLSLSKPTVDGDSSAITGKRAWDGLCALLVDLGPPLEVPRLSSATSFQHTDFINLMTRFANRNTSSVEHLFLETDVQENTAVFVLPLSRVNVEGLDIELLMYHILKVGLILCELYRSRLFDIILDCTSFAANSEVPLQNLKYCAELIPLDIRSRFAATRILNPNTLTQKYLRRLYNISAGTPLCNEVKAYTSVLQLMEDVRTLALPALAYPVSLEQEVHESFSDVTLKSSVRIPVVLELTPWKVKSLPISPGLSCKSTELIPLTDVSDIYNVSTGAEPYEFIIRRRQGLTMYLSSPAREQIVKTIRSAKGRLKEVQAPLTERFSRFSNVPATLLHIGFLSVDLDDEELRGAAYDLLGAVCSYLKYDKSPIVANKGDPIAFVLQLSEKLAEFAPQLTLDFIHEVSAAMTSMDKSTGSRRISCLQYMSPWIQNLSLFANATHPLFERSGARLRDCIRTLADLSLAFPEITSSIQKHIWVEVAKLDSIIVDAILDELALSKMPPKISNTLLEHPNWNEVSTLIRLSLVIGSQSTQSGHNYLYVPEVVHLVSLTAAEGPSLVRKSVYGITMNLLQSLYIARPDDSTEPGLMQLINHCTSAETLRLFGLQRETPTSEYTNVDPVNEKDCLDTQEQLAQLLIRILNVSAGTTGLLNVWRARWMSLVTSTAFQQSAAVQTRSFVVLGALAVAAVDDDFLYQILVAFRSALLKANESNTMAIVSMLRCMCKIVPAIVETSRYVGVLFWLGVALLQASHLGFYIEATCLLRVTLECIEQSGAFKEASVQAFLLEQREILEEVTSQLDEILRISFETSFSFSLASVIFRGMRHSGLKESAEAALRVLLRVTSGAHDANSEMPNGFKDSPCPEALGYFIALLPVSTTAKSYRRLLKDCHVDDAWVSEAGLSEGDDDDTGTPCLTPANIGIHDSNTALLVASFVGTILTTAQGDDAETEILYGLLSSLANSYPEIIAITYESMQDRIKETFANSSNASIIRSVSNIFRVALQDPTRSSNTSTNVGSTSTLGTLDENSNSPGRSHLLALEELGMQGLANNFQFLPRGHATKMINWIPRLVSHMIS
ncbi:hypothetical protein NLJ89_g7765 [Agrocybe chaxingu]|uniref:Ras-GAP domain-containing protein n=1 Tax=Agrocybe chaxingu TaxID=84603 RepID=A0A9W8JWQ0_9AGAR|nr:hypothetical protein NLJ89_g7765 [Agrocybe chaxingu]